MPFFLEVERMRIKTQAGARNFGEVIVHGYANGIFPACRGTDAVLGEKNPKCFEALAQITDKYQLLNGKNPAFFLEPERYKCTI